MARLVSGGDGFQRGRGRQGGIDLVLGELAAVEEVGVDETGVRGGRLEEPAVFPGGESLIPDAQNAGATVGAGEQGIAVVDAGVHETDHHTGSASA